MDLSIILAWPKYGVTGKGQGSLQQVGWNFSHSYIPWTCTSILYLGSNPSYDDWPLLRLFCYDPRFISSHGNESIKSFPLYQWFTTRCPCSLPRAGTIWFSQSTLPTLPINTSSTRLLFTFSTPRHGQSITSFQRHDMIKNTPISASFFLHTIHKSVIHIKESMGGVKKVICVNNHAGRGGCINSHTEDNNM